MLDQKQIEVVLKTLKKRIAELFPGQEPECILFGSYARGMADEGSDVDVMVLLDLPREQIAERNWQIGCIASDVSMDCGVMVSPIAESRSYYESRVDLLPFFSAVDQEGVRLSA